MFTGRSKLLWAASGPCTTSAQFGRVVAEGAIDAGNTGHRRLPCRRFRNGANLRTAEGHGIVSTPRTFQPIWPFPVDLRWGPIDSAIASHLLGRWKRPSEDELPADTHPPRIAAGSRGSQPSATYSCIH
jgi:hypothetical protein